MLLFFKDIIKILIAIVVFGAYWLGKGICLIGECAFGQSIYDYARDGWGTRFLIWLIGVVGFIAMVCIIVLISKIISAISGPIGDTKLESKT